MKIEALFVDRDGIVNRMVFNKKTKKYDSPQSPEAVKLVEGIVPVIIWSNKQNIPVIEITNQPGVAIGKMNRETSDAIETRVHDLLRNEGAKIDRKYICPHHPNGIVPELTKSCDCRKPKPGLLLKAAEDLGIFPANIVFLGDNATDVEAGKNAGCKTIILLHDENFPERIQAAAKADADFKVHSLNEVVPILKRFK